MTYLKKNRMLIALSIFIFVMFIVGIIKSPFIMDTLFTSRMSEEKFIELATQMDDMEKYMSIQGEATVIFDKEAARDDGYSEDIVQLTDEMITFQNQKILSKSIKTSDQELEQYPLLKQYWDAASRYNSK